MFVPTNTTWLDQPTRNPSTHGLESTVELKENIGLQHSIIPIGHCFGLFSEAACTGSLIAQVDPRVSQCTTTSQETIPREEDDDAKEISPRSGGQRTESMQSML